MTVRQKRYPFSKKVKYCVLQDLLQIGSLKAGWQGGNCTPSFAKILSKLLQNRVFCLKFLSCALYLSPTRPKPTFGLGFLIFDIGRYLFMINAFTFSSPCFKRCTLLYQFVPFYASLIRDSNVNSLSSLDQSKKQNKKN